jgi:hypothetical protein
LLVDGINLLDDEISGFGLVQKNEDSRIIVFIWNKIVHILLEIIDRLTPHRNNLKNIERKFTKSVQSFFKTYRFLNALSVVNIFLYSTLFINQNLKNNPEGIKASWNSIDHTSFCGITPCFSLYSGFTHDLASQFSTHLFFQIFFVSASCLYKWAQNDYVDLHYKLY